MILPRPLIAIQKFLLYILSKITKFTGWHNGEPVITDKDEERVPTSSELVDVNNDTEFPFDNCYYATLAGLLRKPVIQLVEETEISETKGMKLSKIRELYKRAGYNGNWVLYKSKGEVKARLREMLCKYPHLKMKCAFAYIYEGKTGHVVVIKSQFHRSLIDILLFVPGQLKYILLDYQDDGKTRIKSKEGIPEDHTCIKLFLYEPGMRYPMKKHSRVAYFRYWLPSIFLWMILLSLSVVFGKVLWNQ